jgi:hypothetical protein
MPGSGRNRVHRADGHDRRRDAFEQVRQRGAAGADGGQEVDRQRRVPVGVGDRQETADPGLHRADVVDQDVDTTEACDRLLDE